MYVYRDRNKPADLLAKERGKKLSVGSPSILIVPPGFILTTIDADKLGTSYGRKISICDIKTNGPTPGQTTFYAHQGTAVT